MKTFLRRLLLFCLPLLLWVGLEAYLPSTQWQFRHFKGMRFDWYQKDLPNFQNQHSFLVAEGDLCPRTPFAIPKEELWITDALGYRNERFTHSPKILLIGDSFILGSGLTQSEILSHQLNELLGDSTAVYAMAPADLSQYFQLVQHGILHPPQILIYQHVERLLPASLDSAKIQTPPAFTRGLKAWLHDSEMDILMDKAFRFYAFRAGLKRLTSTLYPKPLGIQSPTYTGLFFLNAENSTYEPEALDAFGHLLETTHRELQTTSTRFIYLPIPNKETLYSRYHPNAMDDRAYQQLLRTAQNLNIEVVNTLQLLQTVDGEALTYHLDDSHWNAEGVHRVAQALQLLIQNDAPIPPLK